MERYIPIEDIRAERASKKEMFNNPNRGSIRFLKKAVIAAGLAHLFSTSAEATGGNCIINVNVAEVPANQPPFTAFFRSATGQTVHVERNVVVGRNFRFDAPSSDGRTFTVIVATDTNSITNTETGLCTPTVKNLRFRPPVVTQPPTPPVDSGRPADFWDSLRRFFTEPRLSYGNVFNPGGVFTNPMTYVVVGVGGFFIGRARNRQLVRNAEEARRTAEQATTAANNERQMVLSRNQELEGLNTGLENQVLAERQAAARSDQQAGDALGQAATAQAEADSEQQRRADADALRDQYAATVQDLSDQITGLEGQIQNLQNQVNTATGATTDAAGNAVYPVKIVAQPGAMAQQAAAGTPGFTIVP